MFTVSFRTSFAVVALPAQPISRSQQLRKHCSLQLLRRSSRGFRRCFILNRPNEQQQLRQAAVLNIKRRLNDVHVITWPCQTEKLRNSYCGSRIQKINKKYQTTKIPNFYLGQFTAILTETFVASLSIYKQMRG